MVRDAFAFGESDGTTNFDEVENALEKIETRGNKILRKIRVKQAINEEDKQIFAEYVGYMIKRSFALDPSKKRKVEDAVDSADWLGLQRAFQLAGRFDLARTIAYRENLVPRLKDAVHKTSVSSPMPQSIAALSRMSWRFLIARRVRFS